jgi:hypothetical protein
MKNKVPARRIVSDVATAFTAVEHLYLDREVHG